MRRLPVDGMLSMQPLQGHAAEDNFRRIRGRNVLGAVVQAMERAAQCELPTQAVRPGSRSRPEEPPPPKDLAADRARLAAWIAAPRTSSPGWMSGGIARRAGGVVVIHVVGLGAGVQSTTMGAHGGP